MRLARTGYAGVTDTAALDADGVLLDFNGGFLQVAQEVLGRPLRQLSNAYRMSPRYGITQAERNQVWLEMIHHPSGWRNLPPIPGAIEAVARLRAWGLRIQVVTAIPTALIDLRMANFEQHGLVIDGIDCVGDAPSKRPFLIPRRPLMFVDDRLSLVHEADFVPHAVWVNTGDDQESQGLHEGIVETSSLARWVEDFGRQHGCH